MLPRNSTEPFTRGILRLRSKWPYTITGDHKSVTTAETPEEFLCLSPPCIKVAALDCSMRPMERDKDSPKRTTAEAQDEPPGVSMEDINLVL